MSQSLQYVENLFDRIVCLEDIINTPDDSDFGYFLEVDLKYLHNIRQKIKHFTIAPENKIISGNDFDDYKKKTKPKNYMSLKNLICDCTDKKK